MFKWYESTLSFFGGMMVFKGDCYCEVCQAIVVKIWHDLNSQHVSCVCLCVCVCVGGGGVGRKTHESTCFHVPVSKNEGAPWLNGKALHIDELATVTVMIHILMIYELIYLDINQLIHVSLLY